jgi:lipid-A-disaccharide synthase
MFQPRARMKPLTFMVVAGEPSGDLLAAELVKALGRFPQAGEAQFFGAGGPQMASAGVELAFDLTEHAVVGLWEVLGNYAKFRRLFNKLLSLAAERKPDAIICVDFSGFNRRFAHAIRRRLHGADKSWRPLIVQYVSPQVWASRPGRAQAIARDFDLLLAIFPFEQAWYAKRVPKFKVEFVGHPICERFGVQPQKVHHHGSKPLVLLLPGSRTGELKRHLPVMLAAIDEIKARSPVDFRLVLPNQALAAQAQSQVPGISAGDVLRIGNLPASLAEAALAIAATGTVTLECAYFRVPTVTLYKTSWLTYEIGKRLVTVSSLTMPNLLAGEVLFPEFLQEKATPTNIAHAALGLLNDSILREALRAKLASVMETLGGPGASQRAARAVLELLATSGQRTS